MSCLSEFKVVAIMDKSEDYITENLSEQKPSFLKNFFNKIKRKIYDLFLGGIL
ncbi:hypothetical protein [Desulfobotulus alkaliphilus]|uniref:hypothetical protein n=1 Tax=Desulfobotulus alkaliphilus TaxID=622671 RepID=UPI001648964F|nr:hypothetical protein [Desulfobotulus alkaliphilus]